MPSIVKVPLPTREAVFPLRSIQDYYEWNSFVNYRTSAKSFPPLNGFESNHTGVLQSVFRKQAPKIEASRLNKPAQLKWFTDKLPLNSDSVVLDLNCGTGIVARSIAPKVAEVHGTDLSRHLLDFARTKPVENVDFQRAEAAELPYADNTFDVVFSRMSFNHLMHREEVVAEMRRVCKPGGHIALLERVIPDELDEATIVRMEYIEGLRDASHIYFMTPAELNLLFKDNNITVTTKETHTCTEPYEDYLSQTDVVSKDRAVISQWVYGNMIAPDPEYDQKTGFYPHLVDDEVTITHHFALIGGTNPTEKPQAKE